MDIKRYQEGGPILRQRKRTGYKKMSMYELAKASGAGAAATPSSTSVASTSKLTAAQKNAQMDPYGLKDAKLLSSDVGFIAKKATALKAAMSTLYTEGKSSSAQYKQYANEYATLKDRVKKLENEKVAYDKDKSNIEKNSAGDNLAVNNGMVIVRDEHGGLSRIPQSKLLTTIVTDSHGNSALKYTPLRINELLDLRATTLNSDDAKALDIDGVLSNAMGDKEVDSKVEGLEHTMGISGSKGSGQVSIGGKTYQLAKIGTDADLTQAIQGRALQAGGQRLENFTDSYFLQDAMEKQNQALQSGKALSQQQVNEMRGASKNSQIVERLVSAVTKDLGLDATNTSGGLDKATGVSDVTRAYIASGTNKLHYQTYNKDGHIITKNSMGATIPGGIKMIQAGRSKVDKKGKSVVSDVVSKNDWLNNNTDLSKAVVAGDANKSIHDIQSSGRGMDSAIVDSSSKPLATFSLAIKHSDGSITLKPELNDEISKIKAENVAYMAKHGGTSMTPKQIQDLIDSKAGVKGDERVVRVPVLKLNVITKVKEGSHYGSPVLKSDTDTWTKIEDQLENGVGKTDDWGKNDTYSIPMLIPLDKASLVNKTTKLDQGQLQLLSEANMEQAYDATQISESDLVAANKLIAKKHEGGKLEVPEERDDIEEGLKILAETRAAIYDIFK